MPFDFAWVGQRDQELTSCLRLIQLSSCKGGQPPCWSGLRAPAPNPARRTLTPRLGGGYQ